MKHFRRFILWTLVFVFLLFVADQVLMQVPLEAPVVKQVQVFYQDFRTRLVAMVMGEESPKTIGQVIDKSKKKAADSTVEVKKQIENLERKVESVLPQIPIPPPAKPAPKRYVYADEAGAIHFADSLEEVPEAFRKGAQPLQE
ncbi:MAG: hypothetical protein C0616_06015 [Desulfuromonas sp.]|nr:MAG: hypothetical protein C0616_06015 [Desulfuromonas sp.]